MLSLKLKKLKSARFLLLVLSGVWAVPVLFVLRFLNRFFPLELVCIRSDRIGHFLPDGAEAIARIALDETKKIQFHFLEFDPINKQWAKMLARNIQLRSWCRPVSYFDSKVPIGKKLVRSATLAKSRDVTGLFYQTTKAQLAFTEDEAEFCKDWMRSHGISDGKDFVCLMCRDSNYLLKESRFAGEDFSYHDYRNADIGTFKKSIEYLNSKGVWVIRMGRNMQVRNDINNKRYIDYANCDGASDLLDIWLFSNCTACIGTGTGPDNFPNVYRRPTLFVNFLPLINLHHYHFTLTVPKNLSWIECGEQLTFAEYCDAKFMSSNQYLDAGIEIVDLSEDEIAEAVREFWGRVTGDWVSNKDAEERQSLLWSTYMAYSEHSEEQLWKHPEARIGEQWLKLRGNGFLP